MKNNILFLVVWSMVVFSACAGQPTGDPAQAALDYLSALAEKDKTALVNLSCKSWEEQAVLEADALLSVGAALNNVSCEAAGEDGEFTIVRCAGTLDLTYGDEVRGIELSQRAYYLAEEDGHWRVCSYK